MLENREYATLFSVKTAKYQCETSILWIIRLVRGVCHGEID